jgi:hypothetical protein
MGNCMQRLVGMWVLSAVLAGCGGGDSEPSSPAAGSGSATIGAAGGVVTGEDGAAVRFPANALAADVTVRIAKDGTGAPPLPPVATAAGAVYMITPHGGAFEEPVEVSIPVDRADIAGDGQLLLVTAEPGDTQWRVLSGASYYDGKMRAPVMRFSFFQTIRLVDQIMPTLVTKIDGGNNIGGTGITRISALANLPFPRDDYDNRVLPTNFLVAELSMPTLTTHAGAAVVGGLSPPTPPSTTCRPVAHAHNAMSFRFTRQGSEVFSPQVGHRAVVPREPWPRFPGDGGALVFTDETTIGRSGGFPGFGAIHYYGNESPRISGFHDTNPPTQAQIDAVAATQNRTYPPPLTLPIGNLYAMPTAADNPADNLYTWSGNVWWLPTQNGSVRIDAAIMTTCGLLLEAVPIAFRLAAPPITRNYRHVVPETSSYYLEAAEESEVSMYFGLKDSALRDGWAFNDAGVTYRVEYSPNPTTTAWQPVALSAVTRETFSAANCVYCSQYSQAYGVRVSFPAVQQSQSGFYRVFSCSDEGCFDGQAGQLVVLRNPPSITAQPGGHTVQVGETASFTVGVSGAPAPALQWQKRSVAAAAFGFLAWTNIDGATAATYTTPPLAAVDTATQYRMWVSNALGGVASDAAMLIVVEQFAPPVIQSQPGNLNVTVGATAVFASTVSGAAPLSYQWRRNGTALTGANSPVLTLSNVSALNDGRYELVVTNRAGSVTSEPAVLQVTLGTPVALAPTIAAPPASISVAEGNAANFAVAVTGTGPYTYLWMKNGVQAPIPNGDLASFSLAAVSAADAGTYSVRVTNNVGTVVSAAATLTVTAGTGVTLPPTITTAPAGVAVLPGGAATFAVAVAGTGPFTYQWRRDGADISGATGAVLRIAAVTALDAGQYTLEVRNAAGAAASSAVPLIVIGAPVISAQPAAATASAGATALFAVTATGDGLRYQWLRNGVAISGAVAASYSTPALAVGDSGAVYGVLVYNGAGVVFSQDAVLSVTAPVSAWVTPAAIETDDTGPAQQPAISVNTAGEALSVWMKPGDGVWANRYTPAGGWGTAQRVSDGQGSQGAHEVAIDASGNAIAVWQQADDIWANRYTAGSGWGTPDRIEGQPGRAGNPQIGTDANGNAIAVWWQYTGSRIGVAAARYSAGGGWGVPENIVNDDPGDASAPQVAVDAAGNAMAVWAWSADTGGNNYIYNVRAARYVAGFGWAGAVFLDSNGMAQPNPSPQVALSANGTAIAVWHRNISGIDSVTSSHYTPGGGWSSSLEVDPAVLSRNARVAIDSEGNALAVWEQYVGATANVIASRFNGGTWDAPTLIETDNAGSAYTPRIVMDANGVGTAFWSQRNAAGFTNNVWVNRYVPGNGWGSATAIDGQAGPATQPALGVDASGRLVVVWEQVVGSVMSLWASGFR